MNNRSIVLLLILALTFTGAVLSQDTRTRTVRSQFTEEELSDIPAGYDCPPDFAGYLTPQLEIGLAGVAVNLSSATSSQLHALPDVRGMILGEAQPGDVVTRIADGPACSGVSVWWLVEVNGVVGWVAESKVDEGVYFVEPGTATANVSTMVPSDQATADADGDGVEDAVDFCEGEGVAGAVDDFGCPMAEATASSALPTPVIEETAIAEPDVRIDYGAFGITLVNLSDSALPLASFTFSSETGGFAGADWNYSSLKAGDCVQLYYSGSPRPAKPSDCRQAQRWIERGTPGILFWQSAFTVSFNGEKVGVCAEAANNDQDIQSCEIAVD